MAGRPKKKSSDRMDDMLRIRIKSTEREILEKAAAADDRQLSPWARLQLLKAAAAKTKGI